MSLSCISRVDTRLLGDGGVNSPNPYTGLYIVSINAIVPMCHHTLCCITRIDISDVHEGVRGGRQPKPPNRAVHCIHLCHIVLVPISPCAALPGLTSAMYMRGSEGVGNPDPQAGLYIRQRQGAEVVQAPIPADQIAFQMGEAMQVSAPPPLPPPSCVHAQSHCARSCTITLCKLSCVYAVMSCIECGKMALVP